MKELNIINLEQIKEFLAEKGSQEVLVLGLGISGFSAALLCRRTGLRVGVLEVQSKSEFTSKVTCGERLAKLNEVEVEVTFGVNEACLKKRLEGQPLFCVLSPGLSKSWLKLLAEHRTPVISELQLGLECLGANTILVSGSNGKSTTASLIHSLLNRVHKSTLVGNIGTPPCEFVSSLTTQQKERGVEEFVVAEVSSYQLDISGPLFAKAAVLLNISENHLEKHGTLDNYLSAKARMFLGQEKSDIGVLNCDDDKVFALADSLDTDVVFFGQDTRRVQELRGAFWRIERSQKFIRISNLSGVDQEIRLLNCHLIGSHNLYNISAVVALLVFLGVPLDEIGQGLQEFQPLEHRLERVNNDSGFVVLNDSKSTTIASTLAAVKAVLEDFPNSGLILMLGGRPKKNDWEPLLTTIEENLGRMEMCICVGEASQTLGKLLEDRFGELVSLAESLESGVSLALARLKRHAQNVLLFSPACSSFDEFSDFMERGSVFKSLICTTSKV